MRATSIAARAGLALGLFLAWTPVNAEQSFPAEPEQSFPTEPEQPFAFEPVPVRRWRASAAFGYEYDSGIERGATQQFVPFAARLEYGPLAVAVTTSWTSIEGEQIVTGFSIPGLSSARLEAALARINARLGSEIGVEDIADLSLEASGVGDTLISLSYTWFDPDHWLPFIELTGSVKIPTASEEGLIGTGRYDWILQLDVAKPIGRFTPFASVAYRFNGSPIVLGQRSVAITRPEVIALTGQSSLILDEVRIPVQDSVQAAVGSSVLVTDSLTRIGGRDVGLYLGALYDFEQSPFEGVGAAHEIVTYLTFDLFGRLQFGPSVIAGLSRSAPDWGIATQVMVSY